MSRDVAQYNLFCNAHKGDLYCAVPEWLPVPGFIRAPGWTFVSEISEAAAPQGFLPAVARQGARWNGYYLFQSWSRGTGSRRAAALPTAA
ncbi:hypothetical protein [Methylobacterium sp. JK268]